MKTYRVSRSSMMEPRASSGAVVYEPAVSDFGLAHDDTVESGVPHVSVTLNPDGQGPVFTIPAADLVAVEEASTAALPERGGAPGGARQSLLPQILAGGRPGKGLVPSTLRLLYGPRAVLVSLALLVVIGALFAAFPALDFHTSDFFEDMTPSWKWLHSPWALESHFLVRAFFDIVILTFMLKGAAMLIWPRARHFSSLRTVFAVLVILLAGPPLVKGVAWLGDFARPKPLVAIEAYEQGRISRDNPVLMAQSPLQAGVEREGGADFLPWFMGAGTCEGNCTTISRDVAAAAALIAAGAVLPDTIGLLAVIGAMIFAAGVALLRIGVGEVYLSDTLLAILLMHILSWATFRSFGTTQPPTGNGNLLDIWREMAASSAKQGGRALLMLARRLSPTP